MRKITNADRISTGAMCGLVGCVGMVIPLVVAVIAGPDSSVIDYVPYGFAVPVIGVVLGAVYTRQISKWMDE